MAKLINAPYAKQQDPTGQSLVTVCIGTQARTIAKHFNEMGKSAVSFLGVFVNHLQNLTACSLTLLKFPIKETHRMSHFMFVNNIIANLNKSSKED